MSDTQIKPNTELAYKVLDQIDAHPEQWNQNQWISQAECGTVGCFAGWACMLSGDQPLFDPFDNFEAEEVWVAYDEQRSYIPVRAAHLLGIPYHSGSEFGHGMFNPRNDREDLGRYVEEIFGPRPGGAK